MEEVRQLITITTQVEEQVFRIEEAIKLSLKKKEVIVNVLQVERMTPPTKDKTLTIQWLG